MDLNWPESSYQIITVTPSKREYQLVEPIQIRQVYILVNYNPTTGSFSSMQPVLPTDKPTLLGQNVEEYDQSANTPGYPNFTPQVWAQPPVQYPLTTGGRGRYPQPTMQPYTANSQPPHYYMRGGFLGFSDIPLGTYYIQIESTPVPPPLIDNNTECIFPQIAKDALAYMTASYCALSDSSSRVQTFMTSVPTATQGEVTALEG